MSIYEIFIEVALELLKLSEAVMDGWMNVPQNATGPTDTGITLTTAGTQLVENIAASANGIVDLLNNMLQNETL